MTHVENDAYGRPIAAGYLEARQRVLDSAPTGPVRDHRGRPRIAALVTDLGRERGVLTLCVECDGTISFYSHAGGGMVNVGVHPGPAQAAAALLEQAHLVSEHHDPAIGGGLPGPGVVAFHLVTSVGTHRARVPEEALRRGHGLQTVYLGVQLVLAATRQLGAQ